MIFNDTFAITDSMLIAVFFHSLQKSYVFLDAESLSKSSAWLEHNLLKAIMDLVMDNLLKGHGWAKKLEDIQAELRFWNVIITGISETRPTTQGRGFPCSRDSLDTELKDLAHIV